VDGDTIKVGDMPVRLYGVDAPEGRQTHHSRSAMRSYVLVEAVASLVQRGLGRGVLGGRCLPVEKKWRPVGVSNPCFRRERSKATPEVCHWDRQRTRPRAVS